MEQLSNRLPHITCVGWNVVEAAPKRVVVSGCCVVDAKSRVNSRSDILSVHGASLGPTRIFDIRAIRSGFPKGASALNSAARDESGMHKVVIAPLLTCDVADRAAELAFRHDQRFIEQCPSVASRNHGEIREKIRETNIELPRRRIDAGIVAVNVLVVVPAAKRDLNVPRP